MPERIEIVVGKRIAQARKQAGLTQEKLAEKLYWKREEIARFETAQRTPRIKVLAEIAEVLNVPMTFFFEQDDPTDAT